MIKFEVWRNRTEEHIYTLPESYRAEISTCPEQPTLVERFDTLEAARSYLHSTHGTKVADIYSTQAYGKGWLIIADYFYIAEAEYDDDGEFIQGGDVWETSAMPEEFTVGTRTYKHTSGYDFDLVAEEEELWIYVVECTRAGEYIEIAVTDDEDAAVKAAESYYANLTENEQKQVESLIVGGYNVCVPGHMTAQEAWKYANDTGLMEYAGADTELDILAAIDESAIDESES